MARGTGAGVAWTGCLSCSNSLLPSTVAPWGQKELPLGQSPVGTEWPRATRGWRGSHKPLPAHLHGLEGLLGLCLPGEVDEGTAAPREQSHGTDLPKPGGHRPPNVGGKSKWRDGGLEIPNSAGWESQRLSNMQTPRMKNSSLFPKSAECRPEEEQLKTPQAVGQRPPNLGAVCDYSLSIPCRSKPPENEDRDRAGDLGGPQGCATGLGSWRNSGPGGSLTGQRHDAAPSH